MSQGGYSREARFSPCEAQTGADDHQVPVLRAHSRADLAADAADEVVEQRAEGGCHRCGGDEGRLHVAAMLADQRCLDGTRNRRCSCAQTEQKLCERVTLASVWSARLPECRLPDGIPVGGGGKLEPLNWLNRSM